MKIASRKPLALLATLIPLAITMTVDANTVTLYQGDYSFGVGGEFTAASSDSGFSAASLLNDGYVQNVTEGYVGHQSGGFQTFCVESGVEFSPGTAYTYTLGSSTAPDGGLAGSGLNLSVGTAYLYYKFATATLTGYNYANSGPGLSRIQDAGLLQAAIWALQGGQTYSGYPVPTIANNAFYAAAIAATGGTLAAATAANNGTYDVDIMQMFGGNIPAQAQLVLGPPLPSPTPVPDSGTTVCLLAVGLIGIFLFRSIQPKTA
jgi:VPDSG-CTERM motif